MVSLTATLFKAIIDDSDLVAATAEYIIDLAISEISNRSGQDLPEMTGTAGSKTVSLDQKEYAAVMEAARAVYYGFYKGITNPTLSGLSVTNPDLKADPNVDAQIERAARRLAEFDVDYG